MSTPSRTASLPTKLGSNNGEIDGGSGGGGDGGGDDGGSTTIPLEIPTLTVQPATPPSSRRRKAGINDVNGVNGVNEMFASPAPARAPAPGNGAHTGAGAGAGATSTTLSLEGCNGGDESIIRDAAVRLIGMTSPPSPLTPRRARNGDSVVIPGVALLATYVGQTTARAENVRGLNRASTADLAVRLCSADDNRLAVNKPASIVMVNDVLVVSASSEGGEELVSTSRKDVVFCARGSEKPDYFVVVRRSQTRTGAISCDVFSCGSQMACLRVVEGLARAFGVCTEFKKNSSSGGNNGGGNSPAVPRKGVGCSPLRVEPPTPGREPPLTTHDDEVLGGGGRCGDDVVAARLGIEKKEFGDKQSKAAVATEEAAEAETEGGAGVREVCFRYKGYCEVVFDSVGELRGVTRAAMQLYGPLPSATKRLLVAAADTAGVSLLDADTRAILRRYSRNALLYTATENVTVARKKTEAGSGAEAGTISCFALVLSRPGTVATGATFCHIFTCEYPGLADSVMRLLPEPLMATAVARMEKRLVDLEGRLSGCSPRSSSIVLQGEMRTLSEEDQAKLRQNFLVAKSQLPDDMTLEEENQLMLKLVKEYLCETAAVLLSADKSGTAVGNVGTSNSNTTSSNSTAQARHGGESGGGGGRDRAQTLGAGVGSRLRRNLAASMETLWRERGNGSGSGSGGTLGGRKVTLAKTDTLTSFVDRAASVVRSASRSQSVSSEGENALARSSSKSVSTASVPPSSGVAEGGASASTTPVASTAKATVRGWRERLFNKVNSARTSSGTSSAMDGATSASDDSQMAPDAVLRRAMLARREARRATLSSGGTDEVPFSVLRARAASHSSLQKTRRAEEAWEALLNLDVPSPRAWPAAEVRSAVRMGVSALQRGRVWSALAARRNVSRADTGYAELLLQPCIYYHAARIDVDRTFPEHELFAKADGDGQRSLFRLLCAYSCADTELGYCQGLAFVGGLVLMCVPEEAAAFDVLWCALQGTSLREQYLPNMLALKCELYQLSRLLHDTLPELYAHFEKHEVEPLLYAAPWFLCLYSASFPVSFALRVFDFVLLDGPVAVFRVALCLLEHLADELLKCEGVEQILRHIQAGGRAVVAADQTQLLADAMALPITDTLLAQLQKEFLALKAEAEGEAESSVEGGRPPMAPGKGLSAEQASKMWQALQQVRRECKELKSQAKVAEQRMNNAKYSLQDHCGEREAIAAQLETLRAENLELKQRIEAFEASGAGAGAGAGASTGATFTKAVAVDAAEDKDRHGASQADSGSTVV